MYKITCFAKKIYQTRTAKDNMSLSNRRRDLSPSRGTASNSSKLRMDRQPVIARITGSLIFLEFVANCLG